MLEEGVTRAQARVLVELADAEADGRPVYVSAMGSHRRNGALLAVGVDMAASLVADELAEAPGIIIRLTPLGVGLAAAFG